MLPCNKCPKILKNPTDLVSHMKIVHKVRKEWYTCSMCNSSFDELWRFRRHIERCFKKTTTKQRMQNVFLEKANEDFKVFKQFTHNQALDFGCKLASNMNVPRNSVFEIMAHVEKLLTSISDGMKDMITPWIKDEKLYDFENVVSIIKDTFKKVNTEYKLDDCLASEHLISPLRQVNIPNQSNESNEPIDPLLLLFTNEYDYSNSARMYHDDNDHNDDNDGEGAKSCKSKTATLMPVHFQIKSFFESPNVYNRIIHNTNSIRNENKLNHFINGSLWKSKLTNFKEDDVVIPYYLHIDDTQTNNPLGTHTLNGDQTCVYYSFPTIPNEYLARLDNIFTALLFESSLSAKYGNNECYSALVEELNKLADYGIVLNINGKEQKVYFVVGLLLGDNKGLNHCLGFTKSFVHKYYCRFCRLPRDEMQYSYFEKDTEMRNEENYIEDLLIDDMSATGLHENSVFNDLRYFHATENSVDLMHDINEGILHYNLSAAIRYFIKNKYFSLAMLNEEKRKRKYGELEENNISGIIKMKTLKKNKLKMSASESYSFAHHLPFILLNIINEERIEQLSNDEVWKFLLTTLRFLDMSYMTCYDASIIAKLKNVIAQMNEMYVRLFKQTLKAKHHFATHYPALIEKCGPLRYLSSMRYEAHHKFIKNYTKNTQSRKNIAYSIGRKLQYNFAYILKYGVAFKDNMNMTTPRLTKITEEDFYSSILPSKELESLSERDVYVSDNVKVNGLTLSSKLYLPYIDGNQLRLLKIVKVVLLSKDDIFSIRVICQKYAEVNYNNLCASYQATNLQPEMYIMNISQILQQRMYPVVLHKAIGLNLFRFKCF